MLQSEFSYMFGNHTKPKADSREEGHTVRSDHLAGFSEEEDAVW